MILIYGKKGGNILKKLLIRISLVVLIIAIIAYIFLLAKPTTDTDPVEPAPPPVTDPVQPDTEPIPDPEPEPPLQDGATFISNLTEFDYMHEDGTLLAQSSIDIPKFTSGLSDETLETINLYFDDIRADFEIYSEDSLHTYAKQDYEKSLETGTTAMLPYTYFEDFEVTANDETKISVVMTFTDFFGGPKSNSNINAQTFLTANGAYLLFSDIFSVSAEEYNAVLFAEILNKMEQSSDSFFELSINLEAIEQAFNPQDFYFTGDSLVLFFEPYSIAPGVTGIPTFEFPLSDLQDILAEEFKITP